jgi:hypothetical protein
MSYELGGIFQKLTTNLGPHPGGTMHDALGPMQTASFYFQGFSFAYMLTS